MNSIQTFEHECQSSRKLSKMKRWLVLFQRCERNNENGFRSVEVSTFVDLLKVLKNIVIR
jgi:hypothetical protein